MEKDFISSILKIVLKWSQRSDPTWMEYSPSRVNRQRLILDRVRLLDRNPHLWECRNKWEEEASPICYLHNNLGTNWLLKLMPPPSTVSESTINSVLNIEIQGWTHRVGATFPLVLSQAWRILAGSVGEGKGRREHMAPSHPPCHSWDLIKGENIGSDILNLQDPNIFWLFRRTESSGFKGMSCLELLTQNLKPLASQ